MSATTLKDALKSTTSSKSNTSSKDPAYYSREKNLFINEMATNPIDGVRIAAAGSDHIPAGTLKSMLETEIDTDVLRVVLMNPRTPLKAISKFTDDARAEAFDGDEEVTKYLKSRANANAPVEVDEE